MAFTTTVDQAILDWLLTEYTTLYAGYSTADPGKAGAGLAEPAGETGYARVDVSSGMTRTDSTIDNDAEITFPEATGSQGTITYACLFDADSGGNLLWSAALSASKAVTTGDTPRFPAGDFNVTMS